MSSLEYDNFYKSCLDLTRSIIIKSEATARAMNAHDIEYNKYLIAIGEKPFFDEEDPKTWRYYINLSGNYHFLDKLIRIKSLDNGEMIDFTVENLLDHVRTYKEYRKKGYYYKELIKKYPDSTGLINGILNPVKIEKAIAAEDNEILYYDKSLVEFNEYSLMTKVQHYIRVFYSRWNNLEYERSDDLYIASKIGILYCYLPGAIMSFRYEKSRTIEAHPFHIWAYLGSHQYFDNYKGILTLEQVLWFYRNMRKIESNAGKLSNFKELIEHVLTCRNIPIAKIVADTDFTCMSLDNYGGESKGPNGEIIKHLPKPSKEACLHPKIIFNKETLNLHDQQKNDDKQYNTDTLIRNEVHQARDNDKYLDYDLTDINHQFTHRLTSDQLPTKVLESSMEDSTSKQNIRIDEVALNEWIYSSTHGYFNANIVITNPKSARTIQLTQLDALIVYIYAIHQYIGIDLTYIPPISATRVLRNKQLTKEEHLALVDQRYMDKLYYYIAREDLPVREVIVSVERFNEWCLKLVERKQLHYNLWHFNENPMVSSQIHTMTNYFYETILCDMVKKPTTFLAYFDEREIVLKDLTKDDWYRVMTSIFNETYGRITQQGSSLKRIQESMIDILKRLSSYSIQFLTKVTQEDVLRMNWEYLKCRERETKKYDFSYARTSEISAYGFKNKLYEAEKLTLLDDDKSDLTHKHQLKEKEKMDLILDIQDKYSRNHIYFDSRVFVAKFRLVDKSVKWVWDLDHLVPNYEIDDITIFDDTSILVTEPIDRNKLTYKLNPIEPVLVIKPIDRKELNPILNPIEPILTIPWILDVLTGMLDPIDKILIDNNKLVDTLVKKKGDKSILRKIENKIAISNNILPHAKKKW